MPTHKLTVLKDLSPDLVAAWSAIQEGNAELASPFFRPEFFQVVAALRPAARVAVIEEQGRPVGFFAFERGRFGIGRPLAWPMCDFQAVVAPQGLEVAFHRIVRDSRLRGMRFDHLVASQVPKPWPSATLTDSPYLDLGDGFASYCDGRARSGSCVVRETQRKLRRASRDVGAARVVPAVDDPAVFDQLIAWKSAQYRQAGLLDLFAFDWPSRLLHGILARRSAEFRGALSALYLGDRLAAVHCGMRSPLVLHYWFPAYDPALGRHSPGSLLLMELARVMADEGVERIDLGKGDEPYKQRFASDSIPLLEGSLECSPVWSAAQRLWRQTRRWVRSAPVRPIASVPAAWLRRVRQARALR